MQAAPPRTLSKPQFLAKRPHGNYANYLAYVASRRKQLSEGGRGKTTLDPSITNLLGLLPSPSMPAFAPTPFKTQQAQALAGAHASIDPVLANLNATYDRRSTAGTNAIRSFTDFYSGRLQGSADRVQGVYDRQEAGNQALTGALAKFQEGEGAQGASELAAALNAIGAPGAQGDVANAQALGHGAAATGAQYGADALEAISNEGASQEAYANMLPSLAVLAGQQHQSEFLGGLEANRMDDVGAVNAQFPGLVQTALGDSRDRELQKAQLRAGLQSDRGNLAATLFGGMADRDLQAKIAAAGYNLDYDKLKEQSAYHQDTIDARLGATAAANRRAAAHERAATARTDKVEAGKQSRAALKGSGLSQKDVNRLLSESVKYGTQVRTGPVNPTNGLPDPTQALTDRGKAYNRIYSWWKSRLPKAGAAKLEKLSNQTLNQAGYPAKPAGRK